MSDRAIKFRARLLKQEDDKAKGEWVYGLPQQLVDFHGVVNLNVPAEIGYIVSYEPVRMLQSGAPDNNLYWYEIDPQTLGQFTDLLDKHGKEIYEGDIIQRPDVGVPMLVRWNEKNAGFDLTLRDPRDFDAVTIWYTYLSHTDYEVIGNIYETPELLQKAGE